MAAERLTADGVDVLHTIGGDDTATTAADLARYLKDNDYDLTVVGLPKTIDNDIVPIKHSLGAWTAAEQGAAIRPQRGRRAQLQLPHADRARDHGPALRLADRRDRRRVRPLARTPSAGCPSSGCPGTPGACTRSTCRRPTFDLEAEADRLKAVMDTRRQRDDLPVRGRRRWTASSPRWSSPANRSRGIRSDTSRSPRSTRASGSPSSSPPGWAPRRCWCRSPATSRGRRPADETDLLLIKSMTDYAVGCALRGISGVVGHDEEHGDQLRAIEFDRIKGGKRYDIDDAQFVQLLAKIGQPRTPAVG